MATLHDPSVNLPDQARAAAAVLDAEAPWADEHGRLSETAVDALHDHGMFGMWVPESLGGAEADPLTAIETLEALAYGDTNASWVLMAAALATGTAGLYLGEEAVDTLFKPGERFPVIAGQGTLPGTAKTVDGGFRLSGKWSFASGLKHAGWIHTLGIIEETGEPRIFVLPKEQATIVDNWDVLGLKGTGSIDYMIEDVFVPEAFTHFAVTDEGARTDHLHRMTVLGFACICHSGWALGLGRRILDELAENVRGKAGRAGTLADSDAFHQGYAAAEGKLRSARAYVMEVQGEIQETIRAGEPISDRQRTLGWHSLQHATWSVADLGTWAYYTSGTSGLRAGRMQQLFRDLHAGTQHVTSSPKVVGATGRKLAGLADDEVWQGIGLVPAG